MGNICILCENYRQDIFSFSYQAPGTTVPYRSNDSQNSKRDKRNKNNNFQRKEFSSANKQRSQKTNKQGELSKNNLNDNKMN